MTTTSLKNIRIFKDAIAIVIALVFLAACNPAGVKNKVEILSRGATAPATFTVVGGEDKGEFLVGSSSVTFELKVMNNSTASLTDVVLWIDPLGTAAMKFAPDPDGKSTSPGFGGTCLSTIPAGQECSFVVEYKPTFSGSLTQDFKLNYKNLVDAGEETATMTLLAGEAASLNFENEIINYDLGVQERTDVEPIVTNLKMTNVGGLTARNLVFGKIDSTASQPFKVTANDCPESLAIGQSCNLTVEFKAENYGPGAPDGDVDLIYTSNIRYDYVREPGGGLGALTGYFAVNSTKIEGRMEATGLSSVLFDELTVGNKQSKLVKVINNGFKESIVHHVDIYDASNTHYARCSKFGGNNTLVCQDPADTGAAGTNLTLEQLPIKVTDTLGCLINYDDKDYVRNPDKTLSISGLREVAGRTVALPGQSCLFSLTFQPSVEYLTSGNIDGYQFKFVYDSTWKNTRDIKEDTYGSGSAFTLAEAKWASAAQLTVKTFTYSSIDYPDIDPDTTDNNFLFDLGRIALVSDPAYKQRLNTIFKNNGGTAAEIVSIKDGDSYTFADTAADINSYYRDAYSVNCTILNELGGECNIAMDIVPLASSNPDSAAAEAEENSNMYDIQSGYPDQYKEFIVEYKDGSTYEDDGVTPRANRTLRIQARSLLVRKGFLVFEDTSALQGQNQQLVLGDTTYYWIKLKNAGTGGIPYITTMAGETMEKPTTGDTMFPYRYVDRPGTAGEDGADKDCYDFMTYKEVAPPGMPPNTNASSVLGAGETCSLAVRIKMRKNDVYLLNQYDLNDSSIQEWERPFWNGLQNSDAAWETVAPILQARNHDVSFSYYDGDGIADVANGYNPDLDGYGNYYRIAGGNAGYYTVGIQSRYYARLYPDRPYPALNAVICRDELTIPDAVPDPVDDWGNTRTGGTIPERCYNYWDNVFDEEASKSPGVRTKIMAEENGYDFVYYAGTWRTGGSYNLSFVLNKSNGILPASAVDITSQSYTGDTTEISMDTVIGATFNTQALDFTFSPTLDGTYETVLVLNYKNDGLELIDENNLTYSEREGTFRIKIRADAVTNVGTAELEVQDYLVTYDPDTDTVDDTGLDGAPYSFPMYLYNTNATYKLLFRAIRGGKVFAKKKLTYTNNGAFALNDFSFNLKDGIFASGYSNTIPGSGVAVDSNTCSGINLAPAASCEVVITFTASEFEIATREIEADITYQMTADTYYQENTIIRFEARDPAVLDVLGISDENIEDPVGNIIPDSYPINLGFYGAGNPIVNLFPTHTYGKLNIQIDNTSTEKASFLAQWENENGAAPLPAGTWITIYNTNGMSVEATRACFYGDDEVLPIDEDTKGFNSLSANQCRMNFYFDLDDTYLGEEIDPAYANFRLYFYNNERASSDYILFHFKGFVEGNKSDQASGEISNVQSSDDGSLYFSWDPATPQNPAWGAVSGYRVFYSQSKAPLNNIYSDTLPYVDTIDPEVTLTGLFTGSYYYLKVAALRTSPQSGKTYISDMSMARREVIVPADGYFYDYAEKAMIAKTMTSEGGGFGTKSEAMSFCTTERLLINKNGSTVSLPLQLIDSDIYDVIDADEVNNSDYAYKAIPHWMRDSVVDVSSIFTPFDCTATSGTDGDISFYQKTCGDCSCNALSLFIGGDGSDLPYGANVYAEGDAFDAAARCYLPQ